MRALWFLQKNCCIQYAKVKRQTARRAEMPQVYVYQMPDAILFA
jgi:hypothetical protein